MSMLRSLRERVSLRRLFDIQMVSGIVFIVLFLLGCPDWLVGFFAGVTVLTGYYGMCRCLAWILVGKEEEKP